MRRVMDSMVAIVLGWALVFQFGYGEEPDYADRLPRIAPHSPAEALETFSVAPGFRIELVAAEPLVCDPVAMDFDAWGRLFVVEMRGYSEDEEDALGRVRMLVDEDRDGKFDRGVVFAEGLSWPTAILCYDGGVFVGAAPDIWYLKDTDGDEKADVREKIYTGFGRGNVQGLLNSFRWGLDNRIHGATSSSGGAIRRVGASKDKKPLAARGRDFSFDPRTREIRLESGGGQHGMSFDVWGRKFASSNSNHLQQVMYEDRYIARNPLLAAPSPRVSIALDGPAAPVFRTSPVEPWRIVRTELRVAGKVPGPIEGGGKPAGYFTGATGATIYVGDQWPAEWRGVAVIGDVGSNLIHRKKFEPHGLELRARRVDAGREFVASSDIWFRPCQFHNAPDGTLHVADMYREVIEHPKSLPPAIKKHLDLTSGRDRGRIYRILPDDFKQPRRPLLGEAETAELVAALAHPNGWHRRAASRLLYQRQDSAAVAPLEKLAVESDSPVGRMRALYALDGLDALRPEIILAALRDAHPRVREHAVRLSERLIKSADAATKKLLLAALCGLTEDDDAHVRYQLAFTLGEFAAPSATAALARLAARDAESRWARLAILSSSAGRAADLFALLSKDAAWRKTGGGRELLGQLAEQVGLAARPEQVALALRAAEALPEAEAKLARDLAGRLTRALAQSGDSLRERLADQPSAARLVEELVAAAKKSALDARLDEKQRVAAIRTLVLAPWDEARPILTELLTAHQPRAAQLAALRTCARARKPEVVEMLLAAWDGFSPAVRAEATETLLARPEWALAVLSAIEKKQVPFSQFAPARLQLLRRHPNGKLRARAESVLADSALGRRDEVVKAYRAALELSGDAEAGRKTFRKICAACHKLEGVGHALGPDLATIQNRGAEAILLAVLDPNREVNPKYLNYNAITNDGRTLSGMIAAETATSITLVRAEGHRDTILRANLDQLQSSGLSIMPEGLEKQLSRQDLANVIAYLLSIR